MKKKIFAVLVLCLALAMFTLPAWAITEEEAKSLLWTGLEYASVLMDIRAGDEYFKKGAGNKMEKDWGVCCLLPGPNVRSVAAQS